MDYEVYWLGAVERVKFTDYVDALEYARSMTYNETALDTAIIVARKGLCLEHVSIIKWLYGTTWTMEQVQD